MYKLHIQGNEGHRVNTINVDRHTCSRNGIYMWDDGFRYMPISTCYAGCLQSEHLKKFEQLNMHIVDTKGIRKRWRGHGPTAVGKNSMKFAMYQTLFDWSCPESIYEEGPLQSGVGKC